MSADLDALAALEAAATPRPWSAHEFGHYHDDEPSSIVIVQGDDPDWWNAVNDGESIAVLGWDSQEAADAAFIVAAREAVPALIARVREAEKDQRRARAWAKRARAAEAALATVEALCDRANNARVPRDYIAVIQTIRAVIAQYRTEEGT